MGQHKENHFKDGCLNDTGRDKLHVNITLLEHLDVTADEIRREKHKKGPGCRCTLCEKLKELENKWICLDAPSEMPPLRQHQYITTVNGS